MITNIELTDAGVEKFNTWFAGVAKPDVRIDVVMLEMLDRMQDHVSMKESMVYELGRRYTNTGLPELFCLDDADVVVTEEPED